MERIERVENSQSRTAFCNKKQFLNQHTLRSNGRPSSVHSDTVDLANSSVPVTVKEMEEQTIEDETKVSTEKKEDTDSAMDSAEPLNEEANANGNCDNGQVTPTSDALSSPPLCNGNHSDNDSLLTESNRPDSTLVNGTKATDDKTDSVGESKTDEREDNGAMKSKKTRKNGFINGLEKMLESIADKSLKADAITASPNSQTNGELSAAATQQF